MNLQSFAYLAAAATLCQAVDVPRNPYPPTGGGDKLLTFNDTVVDPAIAPSSMSVEWIATEEDGQYLYQDENGSLIIQNIVNNETDVLVSADQVPENAYTYFVKPDLSSVLWATNYKQQYRHSYFADYFIFDVKSDTLTPLAKDQDADIMYAEWNPVGNSIAYVRGNNLFIWEDGETTQITEDGSEDVFNGVPDWVYEEEIFGDRFTLWFSPDGESLAFLSFNETNVPTFTVPYYMDNQEVAPPYPNDLDIRYPKVSEPNPTVEFHLLNLTSYEATTVVAETFAEDDLIIGEVAWVTDGHEKVLFRAFNRVQDESKVVLVDAATSKGTVIRHRDGTDGWIDNLLSVTYVGSIKGESKAQRSGDTDYYLDISDHSGWAHLYLFPTSKDGEPVALTEGNYEVTSILSVDTERQLVYFTSTKHHSTESHVYSVSYSTLEINPLVDDTEAGYYTASFSANSGYYILSYEGPDVPYQDLYSVNSTEPLRTVTSNAETLDKIAEYNLPNITYFELEIPSGEKINVMQRLPANFSPNKKYPALFTPYGGPGAQEVTKAWQSHDWNAYIASDPELEYVTWTVDNRGTGNKGREFRSLVAEQLGLFEAEDQVFAATELAKKPWIDSSRIGIWGWSYGGYLSSKVLETDTDVFSLGLITAPVSDWRLYDSMYTERYMKTYEMNPAGYNASAVRHPVGFQNAAGGFLVQHGTGDDNVHFQHAAALVDMLVGSGVVSPTKMQVQWFTDSDHSINYNGGKTFLYKQLTQKLYEEKMRDAESGLTHQWTKKGRRGWLSV